MSRNPFRVHSGTAVFVAFAMFAGATDAALTTYGSGKLDTDDSTLVCVLPSCPWGVPSELTYTVGFDPAMSVNSSSGAWFYSYSWVNQATAQQGALSHFSIEVSSATNPAGGSAFTSANFLLDSLSPTNGYTGVQIGQDGSSPNDEDGSPLYALKYNRDEDAGDFDNWSLSFYSDRAPMWGDVFVKDGTHGEIYNAGYTAADPVMAFSCAGGNCLELNKTGYNWLAVPDTVVGPPEIPPPGAPEPGTLALLGLGLAGLAATRRRKQ